MKINNNCLGQIYKEQDNSHKVTITTYGMK